MRTKIRGGAGSSRAKRVLIIVQNLPVPFDRRVWLECKALVAAGYDASNLAGGLFAWAGAALPLAPAGGYVL